MPTTLNSGGASSDDTHLFHLFYHDGASLNSPKNTAGQAAKTLNPRLWQGKALEEIAEAFHRAAVVVLAYGEALAMLPYLRRDAVVVHVVEQPLNDLLHQRAREWVQGLAPAGGLSLIEVTNTYQERIVVDLARLASAEW